MDIRWACRDSDFEDNAWAHVESDGFENVSGGAEVEFTVSVSAPAGIAAGIKCVALVIADEVQ